jgi:hypothetical protein
VSTARIPKKVLARHVLPGDRIMVEGAYVPVDASNVYDGFVSIAVPGMDVRFTMDETVWVWR